MSTRCQSGLNPAQTVIETLGEPAARDLLRLLGSDDGVRADTFRQLYGRGGNDALHDLPRALLQAVERPPTLMRAEASTGVPGGEDDYRGTRGAHPRRSRSRRLLDACTERVSEPTRRDVTVDLAVAVAIAVGGTVRFRSVRLLTDLTEGLDPSPSLSAVEWQGGAGKR
jgi:hypothetical protein